MNIRRVVAPIAVAALTGALSMAPPLAGAAQTGDGVAALLATLIESDPDSLADALTDVLADCEDGEAEACSLAALLVDELEDDRDEPSPER
jgi:hypothetical protein